MPNIKSAIKRVQITERNRLRNKSYRSAVRTLVKRYFAAIEAYKAEPSPAAKQEAQDYMSKAYSKIDKAVKKGVLHTNNGARKKAQLDRAFKGLDAASAAPEQADAVASIDVS
ncbi:MAG: 30S ribosomal protein S20 [Elainellaceae cyanobacterium]